MHVQSKADPYNIAQREFDEKNDAKRVFIVGGQMPEFKIEGSSSKEIQIERIEIPQIIVQKEVQIVEIEKIIIQKELQIERVEVPVVIEKIIEVIREVPIIQHELKLVEVPVVIKEIEYKDLPKWIKVCLAVQILSTIIVLLKIIFQ